ncbi:MAG: 2,3-bisphosphoglycerate-dependent phosphoglycerate mutase [Chloroherpetonaceae bacterium]|nr:2,3-bisphosphoglycerate-dependent phosphoglycerate mutase [Chthonomonadaceae bacterium]MDW8208990.1 2,3-bisphosphoglycerate-dependent phosphoglycerate mutase [Chloroherpetonaceae bacterium]
MAKLILLRHGQSQWNLENRFTGWVDVPLTEQGIEEAREAGRRIKAAGLRIDVAYTSVLRRAIDTLTVCLEEAGITDVPVTRDPALNERMYGDLQGLNKDETAAKFGAEQVKLWRRSYDIRPPGGESLKDTAERVLPYFFDRILPELKAGRNVLISAHGNSLRAIVMHLDRMSEADVLELNIPHCVPIIYEFDAEGNVIDKYEL